MSEREHSVGAPSASAQGEFWTPSFCGNRHGNRKDQTASSRPLVPVIDVYMRGQATEFIYLSSRFSDAIQPDPRPLPE